MMNYFNFIGYGKDWLYKKHLFESLSEKLLAQCNPFPILIFWVIN